MIEIFYFVLKFVEFFPLMSSAKSNMLGRKKKKKTEKSFSQNLPRLLYCFFLHSLHVRSNQVVLKSTPVAHGLSYAPRNPLNKQQKAPTSTLCCSFVTELSPRYSLSLSVIFSHVSASLSSSLCNFSFPSQCFWNSFETLTLSTRLVLLGFPVLLLDFSCWKREYTFIPRFWPRTRIFIASVFSDLKVKLPCLLDYHRNCLGDSGLFISDFAIAKVASSEHPQFILFLNSIVIAPCLLFYKYTIAVTWESMYNTLLSF